jgi:hypothetical protein
MSKDKATQADVRLATADLLHTLANARRAAKGQPPKGVMPEMPHASDDVPGWLGGLFSGKGSA